MRPKPTFRDLLTQGYQTQIPLPLPELPGVIRGRIEFCSKCGSVHMDSIDDIVCEFTPLHPT